MLDEVFNRQFKHFLAQQKREADPKRLEMLNKDLTGTIALLRNVVFPVLGSFDNWKLEHRIVNTAGVSLYIDAYYTPLQLGLECEGFTFHAETITRERFSMEKEKVRTMLAQGISYIPFSKDEIDKRPELCRSSLERIMFIRKRGDVPHHLNIYERETLRCAIKLARPIRLSDVSNHLCKSRKVCVKAIQGLVSKNLLKPLDETKTRKHFYVMSE